MSRPDPGGHFASDAHRRVLAAVPIPGDDAIEAGVVIAKTDTDSELDLSSEEVSEILKDLEADGHVTELKTGWRQTKAGHKLLTGPPAESEDA